MPTPNEQLEAIVQDLGNGTIEYQDALTLIAEILGAQGEYTDPGQSAKQYLANRGWNPPSAVGPQPPSTTTPPPGATPLPGGGSAYKPGQADLERYSFEGGAPGASVAQPQPAGAEIPGDPATALGETDPFAAYIRQRGLPAYGGTTYQNWLARQFNPAYSTFQASSFLNPETTPVDFNAYLRGESPLSTRAQAGKLFQQARTGADPFSFQLGLKGTEKNRFLGQPLQELLEAALRGRFAAPVAETMAQWIPDIATQYQADTTGQGRGLLDFLNERLRLR